MEILITHLTRMHDDRVCVAGIDEDSRHIRPLGRGREPFHRGHSATDWQLGNVVRLANPAPVAGFPEDTLVDLGGCSAVRAADDGEIRDRLAAIAVDSLAEAFPGLEPRGHNRWVVSPGSLVRSLAVVRTPVWRTVPKAEHDKALFSYRDPRLPAVSMPVCDLRLFPTGEDLDYERLEGMTSFVDMRTPALVSVGLGRAWSPDDSPPVHWTQVNTVFSGRSDRLVYRGSTAPHLLPSGVDRDGPAKRIVRLTDGRQVPFPSHEWVPVGRWTTTDGGFARDLADSYDLPQEERTTTRRDAPMQTVDGDWSAYLYAIRGDHWLAVRDGEHHSQPWAAFAHRDNSRHHL